MLCVYCGKDAGETKDHVPPKCLLPKPFPTNLLTVPSCVTCNGGASRDEEYFRLIVVGLMCHTPEADRLFDGPTSRSMDRRANIEDLMFGSLRPTGSSVILDIEYPRIFRVAEKIARGLEFATTGDAYPVDREFEVQFNEVEGGSSETAFGPAFTYRRLVGAASGWEFSLFDSVRFMVKAAPARGACGNDSRQA